MIYGLQGKLAWRVYMGESLWACLLSQKYETLKEGHFKKDCPETNKKNSDKKVEHGDASVASNDGYETADALCVSEVESKDAWILDSGYTFHMTPNRDLLEDLHQMIAEMYCLVTTKATRSWKVAQ